MLSTILSVIELGISGSISVTQREDGSRQVVFKGTYVRSESRHRHILITSHTHHVLLTQSNVAYWCLPAQVALPLCTADSSCSLILFLTESFPSSSSLPSSYPLPPSPPSLPFLYYIPAGDKEIKPLSGRTGQIAEYLLITLMEKVVNGLTGTGNP